MSNGLISIIERIIKPSDVAIDTRVRRSLTKKLRQYCIEQRLEFYPEEITKLPDFAREVNDFIEARAKRDLPHEQFQGRAHPSDFRTLTEIGGIIGYHGTLQEITYTKPNQQEVRKIVPPIKSQIINPRIKTYESSCKFTLNLADLARFDTIIDWHSHPVGRGELSEGDAIDVNKTINHLSGKNIYYVLFQPNHNKSYWYQFKKIQP